MKMHSPKIKEVGGFTAPFLSDGSNNRSCGWWGQWKATLPWWGKESEKKSSGAWKHGKEETEGMYPSVSRNDRNPGKGSLPNIRRGGRGD